MFTKQLFTALLLLGTAVLSAQQIPDTAFTFRKDVPSYTAGEGPVVYLDEAHYNFHTLSGRYASFGRVVQEDGYQIRPNTQAFSAIYPTEKGKLLFLVRQLCFPLSCPVLAKAPWA